MKNPLFAILLLGMIILSSCEKKIYIPVNEVKHDTVISRHIERVESKDSIIIMQKNDTVYKTVIRNKNNTIVKHDTVKIISTHTENLPPKKVLLEKENSQKLVLGCVLFIATLVASLFLIRKYVQ